MSYTGHENLDNGAIGAYIRRVQWGGKDIVTLLNFTVESEIVFEENAYVY